MSNQDVNEPGPTLPASGDCGEGGVRDPQGHVWFQYHALTCCKVCGLVKRRNGVNNPCKGQTRIELRDDAQPLQTDEVKR